MTHAIKLDFSEIDNATDAECRALAKSYMRRALRAERATTRLDQELCDLHTKLAEIRDAVDGAVARLSEVALA